MLENTCDSTVRASGAKHVGNLVGAVAGQIQVESHWSIDAGKAMYPELCARLQAFSEHIQTSRLTGLQIIAIYDEEELRADDRCIAGIAVRCWTAERSATCSLKAGERRSF
jgi:hypothetical protein